MRPSDAQRRADVPRGAGGLDERVGVGLIRFLRRPSVFLAANWAALLGLASVVGLVPGLAGSTRATTDPDADDDVTFTAVLRHVRATLVRDLPVTLALWAFLALVVGDVLILRGADVGTRVFLGGAVVPVAWAVTAWVSAYVVSATDPDAPRGVVVREATARFMTRPLRTLGAPVLVLLLSPVWLLAPLTIAIGFSLPPWVLHRWWGPAPELPTNAA